MDVTEETSPKKDSRWSKFFLFVFSVAGVYVLWFLGLNSPNLNEVKFIIFSLGGLLFACSAPVFLTSLIRDWNKEQELEAFGKVVRWGLWILAAGAAWAIAYFTGIIDFIHSTPGWALVIIILLIALLFKRSR